MMPSKRRHRKEKRSGHVPLLCHETVWSLSVESLVEDSITESRRWCGKLLSWLETHGGVLHTTQSNSCIDSTVMVKPSVSLGRPEGALCRVPDSRESCHQRD